MAASLLIEFRKHWSYFLQLDTYLVYNINNPPIPSFLFSSISTSSLFWFSSNSGLGGGRVQLLRGCRWLCHSCTAPRFAIH